MTIGVREAKARFSHYLDVARTTGEVVITDRGTPVARLVGVGSRAARSATRVLAELADAGILEPGEGAAKRKRIRLVATSGGASASAMVRALRR